MLERNRTSSDDDLFVAGSHDKQELIALSDIVAFFRRFWLTIIAFVGFGIAGAVFYLSTTSSRYVATAEILIEPKIAPLISQQPSDINLSLDTAQIESQIAVLQSEKIASMVIDQLQLEKRPLFIRAISPSITQRVKRFFEIAGQTIGLEPADQKTEGKVQTDNVPSDFPPQSPAGMSEFERSRLTMDIFRKDLGIQRVGVSYAISISFASLDPKLSADIANAVADAYMREQVENKAQEALAGTAWLESRLSELRGLMNKATKAEQEFRAKHDYAIHDQTGTSPADGGSDSAIKEPTLEELEVTSETYRKMYESFLQAYTNSVNQQSYSPPNARIITTAASPLTATYPRPKLVLAFGIFAGMLGGVGLAFARQSLDNSIRTQMQLREELGLECIGILPPSPRGLGDSKRYDIVSRYPLSSFSQNLSRIKTVIDFADRGHPLRLLGVVSTEAGAEKSMFAGNLASLSSMNGTRTLIIDADNQHAATLDKLGQPQQRSQFADIDQSTWIFDHIVAVEGHSFDLLSINKVTGSSTLSPDQLKTLIGLLDNYDLIILDLPPLASGIDALAICPLLDGIVISTCWGKTSITQVRELTRILHSIKATIIGAVITNFGR